MSIIRKIKDYYKFSKNKLLFTTPSHTQGEFIIPVMKKMLGEKFFKCDFSEIEGFDNLRQPETIIKDLMFQISQIYGTKQSFVLTNGSTSGIIASMLALLKKGDSVIVARNCHISIYNGLVLTGANPIWVMPEYNPDWDIFTNINPDKIENIFKTNNKIKACIITSPTYEGSYSDIETISKICKKYSAKLIVDEAHGALLNFFDTEIQPAVKSGADISIHSLHKTAGAPNPCSLLHISQNSEINPDLIQQGLNLINTTSPSYPLMLAVEATVKYLASKQGKTKLKDLYKNISDLKKNSNKKINYYNSRYADESKILLKFDNVDSMLAAEILNKQFNIEEEYTNRKSLLFITGIGTTKNKLNKLKAALNKIAENKTLTKTVNNLSENRFTIPKACYTPSDIHNMPDVSTIEIPIDFALDKIAAEPVAAYPPGIPLVLPGEILCNDVLNQIKQLCEKDSIKILK